RGMARGDDHLGARPDQHLRDEEAELPRAEHDGTGSRYGPDLLQDLARRRERFREHGRGVGDAVRDEMQVAFGNDDQVGEGAVGAGDAEHPSRRAVPSETRSTERAAAAREVDLPDDAAADELRIAGGDDAANPFVSEGAAKIEVAARDLDVGATDAREGDANER